MGGGSSSTPANTSPSVNLFRSPGPDVSAGMTLVVRRGQKITRDSDWNTAQVHKLVDAGYKEKYHLNTRKLDKKSAKKKVKLIAARLRKDADFTSEDFQNKKDEAFGAKLDRLIKTHESFFGYNRVRVNISKFDTNKDKEMEPWQK